MYNRQDFNEAYNIIWDICMFSKIINDDTAFRSQFKNVIEDYYQDEYNNIISTFRSFICEDVLKCFLSLGFSQDREDNQYDFWDLTSHALISVPERISYETYIIYCTNYEVKQSVIASFNACLKSNKYHPDGFVLYSFLLEIRKDYANQYIQLLQRVSQYLRKRTTMYFKERQWLDVLMNIPQELSFQVYNQPINEIDTNVNSERETTSPYIERDYFKLIEQTSSELIDFSLFVRNDYKKIIHAFQTNEVLRDQVYDYSSCKFFVDLFIIKDICYIYKKLNHHTDINTIEGKFLFLHIIKVANMEYNYDIFNLCCNEFSDSQDVKDARNHVNDFINSSISFETNLYFDGFYLSRFLSLFDKDLNDKYLTILYRCASVIAKAGGHVSEEDCNWISQIVKQGGYSDNMSISSTQIERKINGEDSQLQELKLLIGLESVKKDVVSLTNFIKMKQKRASKGLKVPNISYHCVFTGNPGTGKTTVARILASIFKELGILKSGHLVETDRSGLVAEYVGQTAVKTNKIIDSALDGVLFIDEAYTLVGGQNDYGKEAIATLLKRMEDNRDRLIVILAGYSNEMEEFINSNPGLRSRFNRYIYFPDYSSSELFDIFQLNASKNEYVITDGASQYLKKKFNDVVQNKQKDFGNARYIRNYFELAIEHQANRLASESNISAERLSELTIEDVNNIFHS